MKYYAVKQGKKKGIFETWDECKDSVTGYTGAIYKSFSNKEDALSFIEGKETTLSSNNPIAYVDGSFNPSNNEYAFGAVLLSGGKELRFKKRYSADQFSEHRNVAGEIKGAGFIIQYAINHKIKELDLYYDYEGIRSWYLGIWKANKEISKIYQEFAFNNKDKIKINFIKVKSHSNVKYNEVVDMLAKEALGIK